jgi:AraC-like DNA-binding protein
MPLTSVDNSAYPTDPQREVELQDILLRLGPVADRQCTRAVVAQYEADIGDPVRTRRGTSIADTSGALPRFLPVRDILRIIFNMDAIAAPDAVPMRLARSPRTTTEDTLALTLAYAPNLRAALDLVARYGDAVLPWYWRSITRVGDELHIAYGPVVPMRRVEPLATEVALVTIQRIVETFVGDRIAAARINFSTPTVSSLAKLRDRCGCPVTSGGPTSFVAIPVAWEALPSPYHDPQLWQDGVARCDADIAAVSDPPLVGRIRSHIAAGLDMQRVVTIAETAKWLGMSSRSLVRALSEAGTSHHITVDLLRQQRARQLLAQSHMPLAKIAEALGFPDQSSFGRKCRRWFGDSPARLRQRMTGPHQTI